jgi:hypothetical protein
MLQKKPATSPNAKIPPPTSPPLAVQKGGKKVNNVWMDVWSADVVREAKGLPIDIKKK